MEATLATSISPVAAAPALAAAFSSWVAVLSSAAFTSVMPVLFERRTGSAAGSRLHRQSLLTAPIQRVRYLRLDPIGAHFKQGVDDVVRLSIGLHALTLDATVVRDCNTTRNNVRHA